MGVKRVFDIRQLKPFHREAAGMPKPAPEKADELADLDPSLLPEEQAYVSHYLGYADILLREDESDGSDLGDRPPTARRGLRQVTGHKVTGRAQAESRNSNVVELPKMQEPEVNENGNRSKDAA